ncbi:133L protein [Yaba-like disease virus]|uniref:3 beta-hydroxysteroid dehydrogenase/Delta 5-->4-isomerase n=1 Tax=Yaba-like disease virus TaxID=132475 RepID=Q9DHI0_YLDV|nr:133L protein [Yaba-like disease virus]CAC21371.1 133L protein [Yaba-like disease virus]
MSVYSVIGGCGFIGKFIVNMLLSDSLVNEIRVIDLKTENITLIKNEVTIKYHQCDIKNLEELVKLTSGVNVVIHCAALNNAYVNIPDEEVYSINFKGTKNVIDACITNEIEFLVFTSCMSVIGPNKTGDVFIGNEYNSYYTSFNNAYSSSKSDAEKIIISSNGIQVGNNKTLKTCALRPTGVYGEENYMLKNLYNYSKKNNNKMLMTVPKGTKSSRVYVGNVAWMHVLAARQIQSPKSKIPGNVYFCYDYSPYCEYDQFNLLILSQLNIKEMYVPLWMLKILSESKMLGIEKCPMLNKYMIYISSSTFIVKTNKAFIDFDYVPMFSFDESLSRTSNWIKSICE